MNSRTRYIVSHVKGMILDVGCVGGDWRMGRATPLSSLHQEIRKKNKDVIGLDLNLQGLKIIKRNRAESNLMCADAYCLPFRDEIFDTLVIGELIEHVSNAGLFLDEAYRVLKEKGILIGDVPNAWDLKGILGLLIFRREPTTRWTTHVHMFDKYSLNLLLLQHGFEAEISYSPIEHVTVFGKIVKTLEKTIYPQTTHWLSFIAKKISRKRTEALLAERIKQLLPRKYIINRWRAQTYFIC